MKTFVKAVGIFAARASCVVWHAFQSKGAEMLPIKPEDITVDKLDEVAREWDQARIYAVTRAEVLVKGNQYRAAVSHAGQLEMQCMLRARRLFMFGITRKEIGELFGVSRKTINQWLKGMD